jgi:phospholipase C
VDQINHLVVLMMENRSFDHVLGALTSVETVKSRYDALQLAISIAKI